MKKLFLVSVIIGNIFILLETYIRVVLDFFVFLGKDSPERAFSLIGFSSIWMLIIAIAFTIPMSILNTVNQKHNYKIPYRIQVLLGFILIIVIEFFSGYILNIKLGLSVWSYSMFPFNLMGQIALIPSLMWLILTPFIYWLDDVIRFYIYDEEKPKKLCEYYISIFKEINYENI
jgi:hypothetical protein